MSQKTLLTKGIVKELWFSTARSGGKGGQNVNKVATKIELFFDLENSLCLTDEQKELARKKLKNKLSENGVLHLSEDRDRSQHKNKELAVKKFLTLMEKSLEKPKPRKASAPTKASLKRKKESKEKRSEIKSTRKKVHI
ncbi:MAG: aminoacyl-tRNA hydrolase [Bacteroidetes bacterium]|jgi:ribosome-associated protein|nr:aminoacyl-tRNA hydrolase [Bacteroidota bacterium]